MNYFDLNWIKERFSRDRKPQTDAKPKGAVRVLIDSIIDFMHEKNYTVLKLRDVIDKNHDGTLEKSEIKQFLEDINIYANDKHLNELMWMLDINHNN